MEASQAGLPAVIDQTQEPIQPARTSAEAAVPNEPKDQELELGNRPMPPQVLNEYGRLRVDLGVDNAQFEATTGHLTDLYADSYKSVLQGNLTGIDLTYLAELEKDQNFSQYYASLFTYYFASISGSDGDSKNFRKLKRALKKAKNLSSVLKVISGYPNSASDYGLVMTHFSNAMSLVMNGTNNLRADKIREFLSSIRVHSENEGEEVELNSLIDGMLGPDGSKFNNQNTVREEAVSAKLTADIAMLAQTDSNVDLGRIFANAAKKKPIKVDRSPQFADSLGVIENFKSALEAKRKEMLNAKIEKDVLDMSLASNREITAQIDSKNDKLTGLKTVLAESKDEIIRIGTPPPAAQAARVAELQKKVRESEAQIGTLTQEVQDLKGKQQDSRSGVDSFQTNKNAALSAHEFAELVSQLAAHINKRISELKKGGAVIDISNFPTLAMIIDLIASSGNAVGFEAKLLEYLSHENMVLIDSEITQLKESLYESRNLSQEEYCMAILTEYYAAKYPHYSEDTLLLMSSSHYVRIQKEYYLQESRRKLLSERASMGLSGVEQVSSQALILLIARERSASLSDEYAPIDGSKANTLNEREALEVINPHMSLGELRNYVEKNSISMDSLVFMMHNLASFYTPRKLEDGTIVCISNEGIADIDKLIANLMKLTSEYAALEVVNNKKQLMASNPELSGLSLLAEALKTYNQSHSEREKSIVVHATSRPSNIMSAARIKQVCDEILKHAIENNVSLEEMENVLRVSGVNGFADMHLREFKRKMGIKEAREKSKVISGKVMESAKSTLMLPVKAFREGWRLTGNGLRRTGRGIRAVAKGIGNGVSIGYNAVANTVLFPFALVNAAVGSPSSITANVKSRFNNLTERIQNFAN